MDVDNIRRSSLVELYELINGHSLRPEISYQTDDVKRQNGGLDKNRTCQNP